MWDGLVKLPQKWSKIWHRHQFPGSHFLVVEFLLAIHFRLQSSPGYKARYFA